MADGCYNTSELVGFCKTLHATILIMLEPEVFPDMHKIQSVVHNEHRLKTVRSIKLAANRDNPVFKNLCVQASKLLNVPIAMISLVDEDIDIIFGQTGLPEYLAKAGQIEAQPSFCQLTVAADMPVVINDVQVDGTFRLFPSVSKQGLRAHLGIPLQVDGQTIGNCCVIDFEPHQWSEQDIAILTQLAAEATQEFKRTAKELPLKS